MTVQVLILLAALASVLLTRTVLLFRHTWVGVDTFYHLCAARAMRERSIERFGERFYVVEDYEYPPLAHVLLSCLGDSPTVQVLGPISDTMNAVLLAWLSLRFNDYSTAVLSVVLYAFTPHLLEASSSIPRALANLFLSGTMLSLLSFFSHQQLAVLLLSMVLCSLVLLTQRLASQSLLVALVAMSLVLWNIVPMLVLLGGLVLSLGLTRGYYLRVLKGHLATLRVRARIGDDYGRHVFNPIRDLFNFPLLVFAPLVFLIAVGNGMTHLFVGVWAFSIVALAVLWPLGEGYRHLMNAWMPYVLLLSLWSKGNLALQVVVVSATILLSLLKLARMSRNVTFILPKETADAGHFLDQRLSATDLILCIPKELVYAILYFSRHGRVLAGSGGHHKGAEFNVAILRRYERLGKYSSLAKAYPVQWIVDITGSTWSDIAKLQFQAGSVKVWQVNG